MFLFIYIVGWHVNVIYNFKRSSISTLGTQIYEETKSYYWIVQSDLCKLYITRNNILGKKELYITTGNKNPIFRSISSLLEIKIVMEEKKRKGKRKRREIPRFLVSVEQRTTDVFYGTWGCILRDTESCWLQSCNLPRWFDNFRIPALLLQPVPYPWQLSLILTDDISLFDGYFSHSDCSSCRTMIYRLHLTLLNRSSPADVAETLVARSLSYCSRLKIKLMEGM